MAASNYVPGVDPLAAEALALAKNVGCVLMERQAQGLADYARLVHRWQRVTNLTAAADPMQFLREHIVDSLAVAPYIGGGRVLDVGSGAGLPGIVLSLARTDLELVLLEPRARRARFLTQAAIELGLSNASVVAQRLEKFDPPRRFDTVISRAFSSLANFVRAGASLREAGARLVAMKGMLVAAELDAAEALAGSAEVVKLKVPGFENRHLVIFAPPGAAGQK